MRSKIRQAVKKDIAQWTAMRCRLWPEGTAKEHAQDIRNDMADPVRECFVAESPDGALIGFLEASLRSIADGCWFSPAGYIEGWWVAPAWRRRGVGKALIRAAEDWALQKGCREMASDAEIRNKRSIKAHKRLGFKEVAKVVQFSKKLKRA